MLKKGRISFRKPWLLIALASISIMLLYFAICAIHQSIKTSRAEALCGADIYALNQACMQKNFQNKDEQEVLEEYFDNAGFQKIGIYKTDNSEYLVFHKFEYYEKGPKEALIIAKINAGLIGHISVNKWLNRNWEMGGGPVSPYKRCIDEVRSCEEFFSE